MLGTCFYGPYDIHRHHGHSPQMCEERRHTQMGEHVCEREHRDPRADGPTGFWALVYGLLVVPMSLILYPQLHTPRAVQGVSGMGPQAPLCLRPPSCPHLVASSWLRAWRLTWGGAWLEELQEGRP